MPNLNKVMLMGNLTRDPETRAAGNAQVCEFGLATNRKWKSKQGEDKEETCFVDCTAWGRTGEVIAEHFSKGRPIYVEGRLQLDQWQDQDGNNRSKLKVIVERFEFLGGRNDQPQQSKPTAPNGESVDLSDDDIPF